MAYTNPHFSQYFPGSEKKTYHYLLPLPSGTLLLTRNVGKSLESRRFILPQTHLHKKVILSFARLHLSININKSGAPSIHPSTSGGKSSLNASCLFRHADFLSHRLSTRHPSELGPLSVGAA
jgi:hypothetical protein